MSTTIESLLRLSRDALLALIPIAEKARISWADNQSYDEWDNIAAAVYSSFVISSFANSMEGASSARICDYDTKYLSYNDASFIIAKYREEENDGSFVFIRFTSQNSLLDSIACHVIDNQLKPITDELKLIFLNDVTFTVSFAQKDGTRDEASFLSFA